MGLQDLLLPFLPFAVDALGSKVKNKALARTALAASMVPSYLQGLSERRQHLSEMSPQMTEWKKLYPYLSDEDIARYMEQEGQIGEGPDFSPVSQGIKTLGQGITWFAPLPVKPAGLALTGLAGILEGLQTANRQHIEPSSEMVLGGLKGLASGVPDVLLGGGLSVLAKANKLKGL